MHTINIEILEKQLEEEKAAFLASIEKKMSAINTLKEMLKTFEQSNNTDNEVRKKSYTSVDINKSSKLARAYSYNFTETIRHIVHDLDGKEFTVAQIEKMLVEEAGDQIPRNPRSRIAMVLKGFIRKGTIELAYKGVGNHRHKYKEVVRKYPRVNGNNSYAPQNHFAAHA